MDQMQFIAIAFSLVLVGYILWIIRKQRLREEYSLLWLGTGVVFLVFSAWRQGLEMLAGVLGIAYAPAALFTIMLVGIVLILIQFSLIISKLSDRSITLAQEYALLQMEVQSLKKEIEEIRATGKDQDISAPDPPAEKA